jgi:hypothetical protein
MSNFRSRKDVSLWVSPTHGPQWIERKYARLGPIDPDRRNPQAQRAREWIAEYERELEVEQIKDTLTKDTIRKNAERILAWQNRRAS